MEIIADTRKYLEKPMSKKGDGILLVEM